MAHEDRSIHTQDTGLINNSVLIIVRPTDRVRVPLQSPPKSLSRAVIVYTRKDNNINDGKEQSRRRGNATPPPQWGRKVKSRTLKKKKINK